MAPVIYLNGTSSSGKSSIARALQARLDDLYLHVTLDTFLQMVPPRGWQREGGAVMTLVRQGSEDGEELQVTFGPLCQPLFIGFHRALGALTSAGNHLIVDDVLLERPWLVEAISALVAHEVCFVGVRCHVDIAEARERARGDRFVGTARGQYEAVHAHGIYDVEVDTAVLTPELCTERILAAQQQVRHPSTFERLAAGFASQDGL